jgi:hypothetical protein
VYNYKKVKTMLRKIIEKDLIKNLIKDFEKHDIFVKTCLGNGIVEDIDKENKTLWFRDVNDTLIEVDFKCVKNYKII